MSYPSGWDLVNITGTYIARDGTPCTGSVTLSSPQLVLRSGTIVPAADIVFELVNGVFSGQIPATDDPNAQPSGWVYTVTENVPGGRQGYQIVAPHTSPGIDLSTVIPVTLPMPPTFGFPYVTLAQLAGTAVGNGAYLIGYQLVATSSVPSTVQKKLSTFVDVVADFGADPTGVVDSTSAFQAAINYANSIGADVQFQGKFLLSNPGITINNSTDTSFDGFRASLIGHGPRQSVLNFSAGNYACITIVGNTSGGIISGQRSEGFIINKADNLGTCINLTSLSHFEANNVRTNGGNIGWILTDILSSTFINCTATFANGGIQALYGSFSSPNALNFIGCTFGNNNTYGGDFQNCSAVNFDGCTFESNNVSSIGGTAATWGVRCSFINDAIQQGTAGAIFNGCYFENNGINGASVTNTGDVWIVNSASPITVMLNGCSFQRHAYYTTNCVRVDSSGGNHTKITVNGCGFRGYSDYTASSSRPYILLSNPSDTVRITALGNEYQNSLEVPVFTNADNITPDFLPNAWVRFNGATATIQGAANISGVTRSATGVYVITFAQPMQNSANFSYGIGLIGGSGFIGVIAESSTSITVNTYNTSGVAADFQVSVQVFGGGRLT